MPGILLCRGVQREGDPAQTGAGRSVLELHHPASFSPADTGPGPLSHPPHKDPGGHGAAVDTSERVTRPVKGTSVLSQKAELDP